MAIHKALLLAFVRIETGVNDGLRITNNSIAQTITFDAGVYPLGVMSRTSDQDSWYTAGDTLFHQFYDKTDGSSGGHAWAIHLDYEDAFDTISGAENNGKVAIDSEGTSGTIHWGHAGTTVDPQWFGRVAAIDGDETINSGTLTVDNTTQASSLAYVGDRPARREDLLYRYFQSNFQADSGKAYRNYYSRIAGRRLSFRSSGFPRSDRDNDTQNLRRFINSLNTANAGGRFLFLPSQSEFNSVPTAWDVDGDTDPARYGWQDLAVRGRVDWTQGPAFEGYYNYWQADFEADTYVAD